VIRESIENVMARNSVCRQRLADDVNLLGVREVVLKRMSQKTKEKSQTLTDKLKEFVDKMIARFKEKLTVFKNKGHISWITKNKDAILK
jgi:hypothetical protein